MEENRSRWGGWPSKPERAVSRFLVGSTPTLFRQFSSEGVQRSPIMPDVSCFFSCALSRLVHGRPLEATPRWGYVWGWLKPPPRVTPTCSLRSRSVRQRRLLSRRSSVTNAACICSARRAAESGGASSIDTTERKSCSRWAQAVAAFRELQRLNGKWPWHRDLTDTRLARLPVAAGRPLNTRT